MTKSQQHQVVFIPSGRRGQVEAGTTVLEAAHQLGAGIESICGGRMTCNKCLVQLETGHFPKHAMTVSAEHLSSPSGEETAALQRMKSSDCRLSCQARITGDVLINVPEGSRATKQVVRKSARQLDIVVAPAIRQCYVEVERAELGEHRGDWKRLQGALAEQWGMDVTSIDINALRQLQPALRHGEQKVTVVVWQEQEVLAVRPGYEEGIYGIAVDIGSTTIAAHLCNLQTGKLLATSATMNPQVRYGEDLMSRISYAMENEDGLARMHKAIIKALNQLGAEVATRAGIRSRRIHEAVFAGNTTMIHILLGVDPIELGGAPFALVTRDGFDMKARDLGLRYHPAANVHILPAEAGHVGADNVAAVLAEAPYEQDEITLMVDVGTNAEIILGNKDWMYSASSPTGPALEGAQIRHGMRAAPGAIERVRVDPVTKEPKFRVIGEELWSDAWNLEREPAYLAAGICGSGIIEVVAELFLAGVLLADGRFDFTCPTPRLTKEGSKGVYLLADASQTTTGKPIHITQDDIRNVQLAKSALYAGAKLLMKKAEITRVDRVLLAGAFGSYIDTKYALILGLIPDCELEKVRAVGNAAGDGARVALLNCDKRTEAQRLVEWITYVETAVDPDFQAEFVGAIHIPHATDPFSHIQHLLPKPKAVADQPKIQKRPRRGRSRREADALAV